MSPTLGRRITLGDGYLGALVKPSKLGTVKADTNDLNADTLTDVTRVHDEIAKVVPKGVIDASGKLHEVDILICATSFNIAFAPPL